MRHKLAKTTVVATALVAATVATVTTHSPPAGAAGSGPAWPVDTWGAPRDSDNVVLKWDEQLLSTIRAFPPQTGPTVTARAIAVVHTAMYDAWAAYDGTAVGFTPGAPGQQTGGTAADRDEAMSYAAYRTLVDLFPPETFTARGGYKTPDVLLAGLGYSTAKADDLQDPATPAGVGNAAAANVITKRHVDGSNQLAGYVNNTSYASKNQWNVVNDRWSWQPMCVMSAAAASRPTPPDPFPATCTGDFSIQRPLTPQWPTIEPFGPKNQATGYPPQFALPGPPTGSAGNAEIDKELADTSNLSDVQKAKAEYWADGPGSEFPPGHMALFAQAFSRMKGNTADQDVKLFFALGNALLDRDGSGADHEFKAGGTVFLIDPAHCLLLDRAST